MTTELNIIRDLRNTKLTCEQIANAHQVSVYKVISIMLHFGLDN